MNFLISDAFAEGAQQAQGGGLQLLLLVVLMFVMMYFMIIRPQTKRAKEHRQMVDALSKGDEVVTSGGLLGKITEVGDNFVKVQVADGVEVRVQKQAVASVMPKGTMKNL